MKTKLMFMLTVIPIIVFPQNQDTILNHKFDSLSNNIFKLGEITVTASTKAENLDRITRKNMENQNRFEVSRSINMLPGVNLTVLGKEMNQWFP